jgi:ankyrin repeat protein
MEKHPKLLHELDEFENTPLNIAVQRGDYKLTFYFISQKANLDLRNKMNQKPLYFAIKNNDIHLMKVY